MTEETKAEPAQKHLWQWFFAILALGVVLRLYGIADRSLWHDEAAQIVETRYIYPSFRLFDTDYSNDPPVYAILVWLWHGVVRHLPGGTLGERACDGWLRLLPCLFGILTIPLTYMLGRATLGDERAALSGAFFFAISPFQVFHAQELRPYSLLGALCALATLLMLRALSDNRIRSWCAFTVCLVATFYVQYSAVWFITTLNVYFTLMLRRHWRQLPYWIVCNLVVIACCIPGLRMASFVSEVYEHAGMKWYVYPDLRLVLITLKDFFAGYAATRFAYWGIFVLAAAFMAAGVASAPKRPRGTLLLFVFAVCPLAINAVYANTRYFPYYTHRLMIASAVPCCLLAGAGWSLIPWRRPAVLAMALACAFTAPCLRDYYIQRMHPLWTHTLGPLYKPDSRDAAQWLRANLREGDYIAHTSFMVALPMGLYLDAEQHTVTLDWPNRTEPNRGYPHWTIYENWGIAAVDLETVAKDARRLWLVEGYPDVYDFHKLAHQVVPWLDAHAVRVFRKEFLGSSIYLYERRPPCDSDFATCQLADYGTHTEIWPRNAEGQSPDISGPALIADFRECPCPEPKDFALEFDIRVIPVAAGTRQSAEIDSDASKPGGRTEFVWEAFSCDGADRSVIAENKKDSLTVSFPVAARDTYRYAFRLRNAARYPRRLECRIYESRHIVEPMGWSRPDPKSSAWAPAFWYAPPEGVYDRSAVFLRWPREQADPGYLEYPLTLPSGSYAVFARLLGNTVEQDLWHAQLRFTSKIDSAPPAPLGLLRVNNPGGEDGWHFRAIGALECDGVCNRLRVDPTNANDLDIAFFNLDRLAIIPAEPDAASTPLPMHLFQIELQPGETRAFMAAGRLGTWDRKRVDIEAIDPQGKLVRSIWFQVLRIVAPPNPPPEDISKD